MNMLHESENMDFQKTRRGAYLLFNLLVDFFFVFSNITVGIIVITTLESPTTRAIIFTGVLDMIMKRTIPVTTSRI